MPSFSNFADFENYLNTKINKSVESACNRILDELQKIIVEEYYDKYCADIFELAPTTMDILNTKIGASAEMNYLRFDVLGQPDVKKHMFYATYKENLENQKNWLRDRFNLFDVADVCGEVMEYYLKNKEMKIILKSGLLKPMRPIVMMFKQWPHS